MAGLLTLTVGLGAVTYKGVQTAAANTKTESDVSILNEAIRVYEVGGGSLDGVNTPQEALEKLKTVATKEDGNNAEIMFLKGSMIDPRLKVVGSEGSWIGRRHVRFNTTTRRFEVIEQAGADTVAGFEMDESVGLAAPREERRQMNWRQAKKNGWVWDHTSAEFTVSSAPIDVAVATSDPVPLPQASSERRPLPPPIFSHDGGTLALSDYPVTLTLRDGSAQAAGYSQIYVSTNDGNSYEAYRGPLNIDPATVVKAYAVSLDEGSFSDSPVEGRQFDAIPVPLQLGTLFETTYSYFDLGGATIAAAASAAPTAFGRVDLTNPGEIPARYQNDGVFRVFWTFDDSDPRISPTRVAGNPFSDGFAGQPIPLTLDSWGNREVMPIKIVALSQNPNVVQNSEVVSVAVSVRKTPLPNPVINPASGRINRNELISMHAGENAAEVPSGAFIQYADDGIDPGASPTPTGGQKYTQPFAAKTLRTVSGMAEVVARTYAPAAFTSWFVSSDSTHEMYQFRMDCTPWPTDDRVIPPSTFDYLTRADGAWFSPSTWQNGIVPPADGIASKSVKISHQVSVSSGDVLLKQEGILYLDGGALTVLNGSMRLEDTGAKLIVKDSALRTKGDFKQLKDTTVYIAESAVEIGAELGRSFLTDGTSSSASFVNDGGYRRLEDVTLNVTQNYMNKGQDVLIRVHGDIGDRGSSNRALDGQDSGNFTNEPNGANSHLLDPLLALINQTLHMDPNRPTESSPSVEAAWVSQKIGASVTFLGRYSPGPVIAQAGEDPYGLLAGGVIRMANFSGDSDTSVDTSWNLIGRGYNLSAILIKSGQGDTLYRVNNGYAWSSNGTIVANVHNLLLSGRAISHVSYFGGPTSSLTPPSEPSRMSIYESGFYIPNGNFGNSGTLDVCAVAYRLSNGSFENKSGGTIIGGDGGNDLVIWINNSFNGNIQNSGAWSGSSVIKWRTDGSNIPQGISGLGPESSSAEMAVEFQ